MRGIECRRPQADEKTSNSLSVNKIAEIHIKSLVGSDNVVLHTACLYCEFCYIIYLHLEFRYQSSVLSFQVQILLSNLILHRYCNFICGGRLIEVFARNSLLIFVFGVFLFAKLLFCEQIYLFIYRIFRHSTISNFSFSRSFYALRLRYVPGRSESIPDI